uniref:Olfactory receptor n=1 Tax=Canis lupus familiaris TaxID=9615 RepID=A0A8P0SQD2_CANLF
MELWNSNLGNGFILVGILNDNGAPKLLYATIAVLYMLAVTSSGLLLLVIIMDAWLYVPIYLLLSQLSLMDLMFASMLFHLLVIRKTISFAGCSIQMIFFLVAGCTESSLLAVMSYDRYVAVCKPLHYSTLMTQKVCVQLTIGSWATGIFVSLVDTSFTLCLSYHGQNIINHYFCEPPALLKLASEETYRAEMAIFAMGVVILLGPVSLILFSYWNIISTVIQIQSGEGRLKVFSTCGSHLIVVVFFYGSTIFTYMRPNSKKINEGDKVISVFYSVITSMMNPFIYSLRNKDVKKAFRKVFGR